MDTPTFPFLTNLLAGVLPPDPILVAELEEVIDPLLAQMDSFRKLAYIDVGFGDHEATQSTVGDNPVQYRLKGAKGTTGHAQLVHDTNRQEACDLFPALHRAGHRFLERVAQRFFPLLARTHVLHTVRFDDGDEAVVLHLNRTSYAAEDFAQAPHIFATLLAMTHATHLNGRSLDALRVLPTTAGTLLISRPVMGDTTITCFGTDRDDRARCHAASIALAKHVHATMPSLTVSR